MASSVIEDARALAEDGDLYEAALSRLLQSLEQPAKPHRDRLATAHRASDLADRIVSRSTALRAALDPGDPDRVRELDALAGDRDQPGGDLAEFYRRLAQVKDHHRKYPTNQNVRIGADRDVDFSALEHNDPEWLDHRFTGDEGLGRYLDLHELHDRWNNLAPASNHGGGGGGGDAGGAGAGTAWKRVSYLQYLATLTDFGLARNLKASPAYASYLTDLLAYLSGFYERVFPLGDLDDLLAKADRDFAERWENGSVPGWEPLEQAAGGAANGAANGSTENGGIWCAACKSGKQRLSSREPATAC